MLAAAAAACFKPQRTLTHERSIAQVPCCCLPFWPQKTHKIEGKSDSVLLANSMLSNMRAALFILFLIPLQ